MTITIPEWLLILVSVAWILKFFAVLLANYLDGGL